MLVATYRKLLPAILLGWSLGAACSSHPPRARPEPADWSQTSLCPRPQPQMAHAARVAGEGVKARPT